MNAGRKELYDQDSRIKQIYEAIRRAPTLSKAAKLVPSEETGRPMTYHGMYAYLKSKGYRVVKVNVLVDQKGKAVNF